MTSSSPPDSNRPKPSIRVINSELSDRLLNAIGNFNPQLLRELKGQLKPRNLGLALGLSLLAQAVLYFLYSAALPSSEIPFHPTRHDFCLTDTDGYSCLFDTEGLVQVDWIAWWSQFSHTLGAGLITILVLGGVYQLIANYAKERQTGTLDFLRLTPQTGDRIFLGKVLGVPAMVYLAVLAAVPLHAALTLLSGYTVANLALFYVSVVEIAVLFFCAAMLVACVGVNQAGLGAVIAGTALYPAVSLLYILFAIPDEIFGDLASRTTMFHWWVLPLGQSRFALMSFCWTWTGITIYWIWQALTRQFRNSNATLLSKTQTYWVTGQITLLWLGFAAKTPSLDRVEWQPMLYFLSMFYLFMTIALNLILMPRRQTMQDWARYRHVQATEAPDTAGNRHSLWMDLLVGEKSPPTLAIAVQLLGALVVCLAWVVGMRAYWTDGVGSGLGATGVLLASFATLLMFSSLLQHILHWKTKQRHAIILACIFLVFTLPPIVLGILTNRPNDAPELWTVFVFGGATFADSASLTAFLAAIATQLATAALLTNQFKRSVQALGRSELHHLAAGRKAS